MMRMSPVTGLAALNKQKYPTFGDDNRMPDKNGGGKDGEKPDKKIPMLPAFMPGQRKILANQLNQGFGGGMGHWNNYLNMAFNPTPIPPFVPGLPREPNNGGGGGGLLPLGGKRHGGETIILGSLNPGPRR